MCGTPRFLPRHTQKSRKERRGEKIGGRVGERKNPSTGNRRLTSLSIGFWRRRPPLAFFFFWFLMAIYFPVLSLSLSLWAARSAVTAFVFRSTLRVLYSFPISSAGRRRYSLGPINKRPHFVCLLVFANGMAARSNDDRPHFFLIIITEFSRHCHGLDRVLARNAETHRCGVRLFLAIDGVVLAWPGHTCPVAATPDVDGSCCRAAIVNLRWAASNKKKKNNAIYSAVSRVAQRGRDFRWQRGGDLFGRNTNTNKKKTKNNPTRPDRRRFYLRSKKA